MKTKRIGIAIVGGSFEFGGGMAMGRPSGFVDKLSHYLRAAIQHCNPGSEVMVGMVNGGSVEQLASIIDEKKIGSHDIVIWMPNVDNQSLKRGHEVKAAMRRDAILVSSKLNSYNRYSFEQLVAHSLGMKANLTIEFSRPKESEGDKTICSRLYDPLGNLWQDYTDEIGMLAGSLAKRLTELMQVKRQGTIHKDDLNIQEAVPSPEFLKYIRECADRFHELMGPDIETTRFLGNASFRCLASFPSYKGPDGGVWVSRRDLDKKKIGLNSFVACKLDKGKVFYEGEHKPSVDTPVQLRLYEHFRNARFMIHGHCYARSDTKDVSVLGIVRKWPCGSLQEASEIADCFERDDVNFAVNIIGHGCLIVADSVEAMREFSFVKRDLPESIETPHGEFMEKMMAEKITALEKKVESLEKSNRYLTRVFIGKVLDDLEHEFEDGTRVIDVVKATNPELVKSLSETIAGAMKETPWEIDD